jgi:hypothetical protein
VGGKSVKFEESRSVSVMAHLDIVLRLKARRQGNFYAITRKDKIFFSKHPK